MCTWRSADVIIIMNKFVRRYFMVCNMENTSSFYILDYVIKKISFEQVNGHKIMDQGINFH